MIVIAIEKPMVMTRYGLISGLNSAWAAKSSAFGHSLLAFRSVGNARLCANVAGHANCDGRQNSAMKTIYNAVHAAHQTEYEFFRGEKSPAFEKPERADWVTLLYNAGAWRNAVAALTTGDPQSPCQPYVRFLRGAHDEFLALGGKAQRFPQCGRFAVCVRRRTEEFRGAYGALLLRCRFSADCWHLAGDRAGADCALTAVDLLNAGERSAFVLTRPLGHHAGRDFFSGYCFLNHAAIAAQALRDAGCARCVAILTSIITTATARGTSSMTAVTHFSSVFTATR